MSTISVTSAFAGTTTPIASAKRPRRSTQNKKGNANHLMALLIDYLSFTFIFYTLI